MIFKVGALVKTIYAARVGVVLQQGEADRTNQTQVLVAGNKEWYRTHHIILISDIKKQNKA